jgi:chemotaxis protein CheC
MNMNLTADQQDAITELVNIAFARTAAALSDLTGNRVELSVPEVTSYPIRDLEPALAKFVQGDVATVHQIFGGPVSGDAFLLLEVDGAARLVGLLTGAKAPTAKMGVSDREVLAEIGNILLNACLGVFGDLLQVRFTFAVPRLQLESLGSMLASLLVGRDEIRHALLVGTRFAVRASDVTGCLVLVLGVTSLAKFIAAVEVWAERAVASGDGG